MILGFRHKALERLFADKDPKGISPSWISKLTRSLARLDEATRPGDMNLPGFMLHPLKGKLEGYWAIRISRNWRLVFRFVGENVTDIDLIDYHQETQETMKNPPHPGLSVLHDCLKPLGLSIAQGARKLGINSKELSELVNCRSAISEDMAHRLDREFGGGAKTWRRLQEAYDCAQAARPAEIVRARMQAPRA